jgi:hypothetical protein
LLYAFALMPTHVHLLIETSEKPLSGFMQRLLFRYTRNYNIRYQTWGHLFQGRYKAILCEKVSYLLELSAYIHLNRLVLALFRIPSNMMDKLSFISGNGEKGLWMWNPFWHSFNGKREGAKLTKSL